MPNEVSILVKFVGWGSDDTCPGVWIGGHSIPATNWTWLEPILQEITYDYWGGSEPHGEDCLLMLPLTGGTYIFADDYCNNTDSPSKHRFICEVSEVEMSQQPLYA